MKLYWHKTSLQLVLFLNRDGSLNCDHTCKFLPRNDISQKAIGTSSSKKKKKRRDGKQKTSRKIQPAFSHGCLPHKEQIIVITRFLEEEKTLSRILPISIFKKMVDLYYMSGSRWDGFRICQATGIKWVFVGVPKLAFLKIAKIFLDNICFQLI